MSSLQWQIIPFHRKFQLATKCAGSDNDSWTVCVTSEIHSKNRKELLLSRQSWYIRPICCSTTPSFTNRGFVLFKEPAFIAVPMYFVPANFSVKIKASPFNLWYESRAYSQASFNIFPVHFVWFFGKEYSSSCRIWWSQKLCTLANIFLISERHNQGIGVHWSVLHLLVFLWRQAFRFWMLQRCKNHGRVTQVA